MRNNQRQPQWDENEADTYGQPGGDYGNFTGYPQDAGNYDMAEEYGAAEGYEGADGYDGDYGEYAPDEERGLMLRPEESLVNVSSTITQHGAPLLSYSRTMSRFYATRKQRMSMGRFKCDVCGDRISMWAWETPNGKRTHDGCYERLAWNWTNLYAQQQRMASEGNFE
ncbi:MAG TPA: hypothetical protein VMV29_17370 [Ktedonobacterales bacterium]|nr:hypothetical protein [Ktedonobacterales bacterium]